MNTTAVISCWWVSGTSLGRPVVPLVCTRMAGLAGRRRVTGRSGGAGVDRRPPLQDVDQGQQGLGRDAGPVGCCLRLVPNVAGLAHDPPPAGELEQDAVRVLEVV